MIGAGPEGFAPVGAIEAADESSPSPITSLLSGSLRRFEYLLWLRPYDPATLSRRDIYLSGGSPWGWYRTSAGETFPTGEAAPHQLFEGLIAQPPNRETRILSDGSVHEGASTVGEAVIADPRRNHRDWGSLIWKNAQAFAYMGAPTWPLSSFARVLRGVSTSLDAQVDRFAIGFQDVVARLQGNFQSSKYRGLGPCIRGDGSSATGSVTLSAPAGAMALECNVRLRSSASSLRYIAGWQNSAAAGGRVLRLGTSGTNSLEAFVINDSGTIFTVVYGTPLDPFRLYQVAFSLDPAAGTLGLVLDGVTVATTVTTGTFDTVLTNFQILRRPDTAANYGDFDMDEIRLWSSARTDAEFLGNKDGQIPSDTAGLAALWRANEGDLGVLYDSTTGVHDITLAGSYAWVDSLTGGAELSGKYIPKGIGIVRKVKPVALATLDTDLIYQVADSYDSIATDTDGPIVEDGGIRPWTLLGTYTDPWAVTPAAGEFMSIPTLGLIRLGSKPTKELTVDVNLTADTDLGSCVLAVVEAPDALDATEVDEGAAAALSVGLLGGVGWLAGLEKESRDSILLRLLASRKAWRAPNALGGELTFGLIRSPETLLPDAEANGNDFALDGIRPASTLPACRDAVISWRRYFQTQDAANLNATLTESRKLDLGQEFRTKANGVNSTVLSWDSSADTAERTTCLDDERDAVTEAAREAEWRSVPRITHLLPLSRPVPKFHVGQVLRITMPVLDYDAGKTVIVGATIADPANGTYAIEVTGKVAITTPLVWDDGDVFTTDDGDAIQVS